MAEPEGPWWWQQRISDTEGVPRNSSPLSSSPPLKSASIEAAVIHIRCCVGGTGFRELEECLASLAAETPLSGAAPSWPEPCPQFFPLKIFKTNSILSIVRRGLRSQAASS